MTVNWKATFTQDTKEYNGLDTEEHRKALLNDPLTRRYAVVMYETSSSKRDFERGGVEDPTIRVVAVEPLDADDAIVAKEMLDGRFKRRTGRDVQPSLFDQDDSQANADAAEHGPEAVGAILNGAVAFQAPPADTEDNTSHAEPPADADAADEPGDEPTDKPKRGRRS